MSNPSLLPIRIEITQPLSRPFRHLSTYAPKSTSHSHVHFVTCPHTQQNQPATLSPILSRVPIRNKINQPLSRPFCHLFPYATKSSATSTPILSLVHIRNKINQPLSRPFCHLSPYATKSTSHSHAHSVTCPYTQLNQPATLTPILSLVPIRNKISQPPSCRVLSFPVGRQRLKFRPMLGSVKSSRKAEMKGGGGESTSGEKYCCVLWFEYVNSSCTLSTYCSTDCLTLKQQLYTFSILQYRLPYINTTCFWHTASINLNYFAFCFLFNCVCSTSLGIKGDNTDFN
jgi:hypothetical protein